MAEAARKPVAVAPQRPAGRGGAAQREVAVRMYRVGLGDCFLLLFRDKGKVTHVLIDCGSLGKPAGRVGVDVRTVGDHVKRVTEGRLDLVVSTHEHADHLSGYRGAETPFEDVEFGEVWMSWCDKPGDQTAERLRTRKAAAVRALQAAGPRLAAMGKAGEERLAAIEQVLEFGAHGAGGSWTAEALEFLRDKVGGDVRYLEPGMKPLAIPGVDGVRVFVLGPPRDEDLITRLDERGATYGLAFGRSDPLALAALARFAGLSLGAADKRRLDEALPFDVKHPLRVPTDRLGPGAALPDGAPPAAAGWNLELLALTKRVYYDDGDPAWRQVEEDWLGSPEGLALKLDNATNNTSLALAIELPDGRVLLFPADAQVGNWQSWAGLSWRGLGRDGADLTTRDLLARTVLYKVGHHGSHNATLREQGLELMTSDALVAMLPVDQEFAREKKGWRRMPLDDLIERLDHKTAGRLIRADVSHADLVAKAPRKGAWKAFVDATRTEDDKLYIEHVIPY